jgi:hypothetical protein
LYFLLVFVMHLAMKRLVLGAALRRHVAFSTSFLAPVTRGDPYFAHVQDLDVRAIVEAMERDALNKDHIVDGVTALSAVTASSAPAAAVLACDRGTMEKVEKLCQLFADETRNELQTMRCQCQAALAQCDETVPILAELKSSLTGAVNSVETRANHPRGGAAAGAKVPTKPLAQPANPKSARKGKAVKAKKKR